MLARTGSVALVGVDAHLVDVEVDVNQGVPKFTIVGLPTKSVREAEQRTRSALQASSERWPPARVVANLAPADLRKDGTHFDLAIALGLIAGDGRMKPEPLRDWVIVGELALDGRVRCVRGVLAAAIACKEAGKRGIVCPAKNVQEAAVVEDIEVVAVETLEQCIGFFRGKWTPPPIPPPPDPKWDDGEDMLEVRGQEAAKTAIEIAAAGGHHLLMCGPPGSGKTMLAKRLRSILPPMSSSEAVEVTRIHSVAGMLESGEALITQRPFRAPHHHVSAAGLVGGGSGLAMPGEITLAHQGVLFLDEVALFRRDALESLRGPLEDGSIRIARVGGAVVMPCRFSLIAAMNPCPCGHAGDGKRACRCTPIQLAAYSARLSGPLLDRFDIFVTMSPVSKEQLLGPPDGEPSSVIRERVERARELQQARYGCGLLTNASAPKRRFDKSVALKDTARVDLGALIDTQGLSGRATTRLLRLARTLADLEGEETVGCDHVGRSFTLRQWRVREVAA